jgi:CRP-like cAMP-binding protein
VCGVAAEALRATAIPNVAKEPVPDCVCLELARDPMESTALFAVRYWLTDLSRDAPTDSEVRSRLHAALRREGISMALPASTVFNADLDHLSGDAQRHRRKERACRAVRGVELFGSLTDDECERLADTMTFCPFAPGELITRQGAVAHYLYILAGGRAEVRVAEDGRESVVSVIDAPGFFGEMGLLTGAPRLASVHAAGVVDCYKLERAAFEGILRDRPVVAESLGAVLARRQVELDAVRTGMDAAGRAARETRESARFTARIREFFGLGD